MAGLFERIQNVFDDHFETERQQARQEGYQRALFETRDALLATALAIKEQWQRDLVRDGDGPVTAKYAARVEALNDAFSTLREMEPRIDTRLDVAQIRAAAMAGADRLARTEHEAGYDVMTKQLYRELFSRLEHTPYTSDLSHLTKERDAIREIAASALSELRSHHMGERTGQKLAQNVANGGPELGHDAGQNREYQRGQMQAITDWSQHHEQRLSREIEPVQSLGQKLDQQDSEATRLRVRM